jgi:DNA-binding transcriptional LysR family regulator
MFNLMHMKFFFDAARNKSVTTAAKQNHVSQSALSQGIQKLEQDLGVDLTIHKKNRFKLTDEGEVVLKHAGKIFGDIKHLQENLQDLKGKIAGTITLACTNSLARFFIPKPLIQTKKKYPDLKVNFHRGSIKFILQSLKEETVDFAIVLDDAVFSPFDKKILSKGEFNIYTKKGDIKEGVYVDQQENPEVLYFKKKIPMLKIIDELSGWGMVEEFVKQGVGPGIMPSFMESKPLKKVDLGIPGFPYQICAVFPKNLPLSRASEAFLHEIY